MPEASAPDAARTAPAPDDREGVSERTVRIGTSTFGARLATVAAGARLPAAAALVIVGDGLLLEAACRMLDPRLAVAAGRVDFAPTCRPLDPVFLAAAGWLRLATTEPVCADVAAGARLPAAAALVIVGDGLLLEAACRMLDPRLAVAAGRVDFAPTCRPLDPVFLAAAGWLRLATTEPVCADDAPPPVMAGSGVAAARREASVVTDCRNGADDVVSARPC
jgi:hypothetical protein